MTSKHPFYISNTEQNLKNHIPLVSVSEPEWQNSLFCDSQQHNTLNFAPFMYSHSIYTETNLKLNSSVFINIPYLINKSNLLQSPVIKV